VIIAKTCEALEVITELKLIRPKYMLELAEAIIHHLRMFNNKSKDLIWTSLVVRIIQLYTKDSAYIEVALELSDPMNNKSSQKLATAILNGIMSRAQLDTH
jgi:hypothetical protein